MESKIVFNSKNKKGLKKKQFKNVFNNDDETEEKDIKNELSKDITIKASQERNISKIESEWSKMLDEDPDLFEIDEYIEKKENEKEEIEKDETIQIKKKQPKYIHSLLDRAREREKEYEIAKEKRNIRKLEEEKSIYGETEQFITPGYLKKLEEKRAQEEAERRKEEEEKQHTVERQSDMTSFYKNLINSYSNPEIKKRKRDEEDNESNKKPAT